MVIDKQHAGNVITFYPEGRLDANSAPELENSLSDLEDVEQLIFDIKSLEYISSAGLRVFLATQKKMNAQNGSMIIRNASRELMDIFDVTGFSDMLTIERRLREISTQGCTLIGAGCCGECWKMDEETILKLYFEGTDRQIIEWEKKYAMEAFKLGIPTAISYDMVTCGNRLGVVFEMLKAKTLADAMSNDLEHLEKYANEFAQMAKLVHTTKAPEGAFPDFTLQLRELLEQNVWMTAQEHDRYLEILDSLPKAETCIHGDFHTSNVMVQNGELMFIDMGDFSAGNPMFDIAHIYNLFELNKSEELCKSITKLDKPERQKFWRFFLKAYYGINTEAQVQEFAHEIMPYVALRQVKYIPFFESTAQTNIGIMREGLFQSIDNQKEIVLPACVEQLDAVFDFVHQILEASECPIKIQMQMDIAIEEIFVNIAHYAYQNRQGKVAIQCEVTQQPRQMLITFTDSGIPYNPLEKEDPDIEASAEQRQIGGLGIFMVKRMVSDIRYEYQNGKNVLTLMKRF